MEVAIKEIFSLAKDKRAALLNQKAPLWNKIKEVCDIVKNGNNTFVIYEYAPFSEITIICKKAKESSDKIARLLLADGYKYITIHRYLRDKENIISVDGKRVVVLFENDIQQTETPYDDSELAKINVYGLRLLYLSRELYNPSIFLDICKKSMNETQLLFLNSMLQSWKAWRVNKDNTEELESVIGGGKFKKFDKAIIKKVNREEDYYSFIISYIHKINEEKCALVVSNMNKYNLIIVSNDIWKIAKQLKDKLNKKFGRGDRFYYEISQKFIYNDFRLKRITFIDKKDRKVAFTLFNNLEYEAIPCSIDKDNSFKIHPAVELRYILYNSIFQTSFEQKELDKAEGINSALALFKKIILEPTKVEEVYYVGRWLDDKVEKIRLGGNMIRL